MFHIILASESPRRKEIMELMGIPYEAMASNIEEYVPECEPDRMVRALARLKADHIHTHMEGRKNKDQDHIIIGADTMVFFQGQALGKPKDTTDAMRMLRMLSGSTHEVFTGVHVIIRRKNKETETVSFSVCTKVTVQPLTLEQMEDYIATGEPMDKAGAYGIQGRFGIYIKGIEGDYYNVVGFPIAQIYAKLLEFGIDIKKLN